MINLAAIKNRPKRRTNLMKKLSKRPGKTAIKEMITYRLQRLRSIGSHPNNKIQASSTLLLAYGIVNIMVNMNAIIHLKLKSHYSVQINS